MEADHRKMVRCHSNTAMKKANAVQGGSKRRLLSRHWEARVLCPRFQQDLAKNLCAFTVIPV